MPGCLQVGAHTLLSESTSSLVISSEPMSALVISSEPVLGDRPGGADVLQFWNVDDCMSVLPAWLQSVQLRAVSVGTCLCWGSLGVLCGSLDD